jgi:hypothetical protein
VIPFHLTAREAARAALKAHEENRLTAQSGAGCVFYDKATGSCCAIGAGLPSVLVAYIDQNECLDAGLEWLVKHAMIVTTDDYDGLLGLMCHHDEWHDMEQLARDPDAAALPHEIRDVPAAAARAHGDFIAYAQRLAQ